MSAVHRGRPRRHLRVWVAVGVAVGLTFASTQSAAFWSVATTPGSAAGAQATSVQRGPTPQVTVIDRNDLRVTWGASTLGDGTPVTGYTLTRYDESGAGRDTTGGCAGTIATTSCTETDVPDGLWTYRVTPRYRSWTGAEGPASSGARADVTPPTNDIYPQVVSGGLARVGAATYYYRGRSAGSLRLVNALRDTGSGPGQSVTGTIGAAGWSHDASSVATPAGGPFVSNLVRWSAGTASEFDLGVSGIDVAGNVAAATLAFRLDNDAPTGGAVGYPNGAVASATITVTTGAVSDARAGVASRVLESSSASLNGNTCEAFGSWQTVTQNPAARVDVTVSAGRCYRFRYLVGDAVGNQLVSTSGNVVRVSRPTYESMVRGTVGLTNYWRLNDSGPSINPAVGGVTGTYHGGAPFVSAGAIAGDEDRAVWFDGADDYGRLTRPIGNDFSIEFWFRTNVAGGPGTNWWQGDGLVDAEVAGEADDFGVSLLSDGRVAAGVGRPDRTVLSPGGFADDVWHHVVMTRAQASGRIELYVDGQLRGATNGSTRALTSSGHIDIGRLQTGVNYYRGALDEVALYSRVLDANTVQEHYLAALP